MPSPLLHPILPETPRPLLSKLTAAQPIASSPILQELYNSHLGGVSLSGKGPYIRVKREQCSSINADPNAQNGMLQSIPSVHKAQLDVLFPVDSVLAGNARDGERSGAGDDGSGRKRNGEGDEAAEDAEGGSRPHTSGRCLCTCTDDDD